MAKKNIKRTISLIQDCRCITCRKIHDEKMREMIRINMKIERLLMNLL